MDRVFYFCAGVAGFLGVALGAFAAHGLKSQIEPEQLAAFETGARYQMYHVLAIRSERHSLFTQGLTSNAPLLGAVVLTLALQLAAIYVPALQAVFKTQPLGPAELTLAVAAAGVVFVAVEIEKWTIRRRDHRRGAGVGA